MAPSTYLGACSRMPSWAALHALLVSPASLRSFGCWDLFRPHWHWGPWKRLFLFSVTLCLSQASVCVGKGLRTATWRTGGLTRPHPDFLHFPPLLSFDASLVQDVGFPFCSCALLLLLNLTPILVILV